MSAPVRLPAELEGLLEPRAYSHPIRALEVVETHLSWVLLTGEIAYKIMRPVRYAFVDLRSADHRAFLCHEEVRLNRRFAPDLYLGVSTITSSDDGVYVDGAGAVIEHAVRMRQFDRRDELDRLIETGRTEPSDLETFGEDLGRIHATLPAAEPGQAWGRPAAVRRVMLENLQECARAARVFGEAAEVLSLREPFERQLEAAGDWMSGRFNSGSVRECHGDLHSGNIVRIGSRLMAFDCLEFEPAFRWIDVADEVSFLLADLESRGRPRHAQAFLGAYLARTGDYEGCRFLQMYKAHRALVRAKVCALTAAGLTEGAAASAQRRYASHVDCARRALAPHQPVLILMSGLSGSGKTWIASRLAPALEAVHARSDLERKRLAGVAAAARSGSSPGGGLYSPAASARVYERLLQAADATLHGGHTTIVDATFSRRELRKKFCDLGARLGVRTCLVHCHAPREVLSTRISERARLQQDPSEADEAVLEWQETRYEPVQADEALIVFELPTEGAVDLDRLTEGIRALPAVR